MPNSNCAVHFCIDMKIHLIKFSTDICKCVYGYEKISTKM